MDNNYLKLFEDLIQNTIISTKQVMNSNAQEHDTEGYKAAEILYNNYKELQERISDNYVLTTADAAQLIISILITTEQLKTYLNNIQKTINIYTNDLLPKLQILADTDETKIADIQASLFTYLEDDNG